MKVCTWEKMAGKYKTSCGHVPTNHGRGWVYCPFCGEICMVSRAEYQRRYHIAHKEQKSEYYKTYYKEHK